jgi:hypothetical protein
MSRQVGPHSHWLKLVIIAEYLRSGPIVSLISMMVLGAVHIGTIIVSLSHIKRLTSLLAVTQENLINSGILQPLVIETRFVLH